MENILNSLPSWVTWVFSGIGCLVLSGLVTLFFKRSKGNNKKITKKSSIKGDNNTVIQNSDSSSIKIGEKIK